jgi:transcriptional regulator with XRE-family HTH domain
MSDDWNQRLGLLGDVIRRQRQQAQMSLRQLADLAQVSNPYLSQIERGLHEPSVRVVRSIARALNLTAEELLERAGMLQSDDDDSDAASGSQGDKGSSTASGAGNRSATDTPPVVDTETAILADPLLSDEQRQALLSVYRSYRGANE